MAASKKPEKPESNRDSGTGASLLPFSGCGHPWRWFRESMPGSFAFGLLVWMAVHTVDFIMRSQEEQQLLLVSDQTDCSPQGLHRRIAAGPPAASRAAWFRNLPDRHAQTAATSRHSPRKLVQPGADHRPAHHRRRHGLPSLAGRSADPSLTRQTGGSFCPWVLLPIKIGMPYISSR